MKKGTKHDETFEDTWEGRENEWLPYVKNDVLSTAFCYARCTMGLEGLTGFGMKNSSILPLLSNRFFKSLRDEDNEPIYIYTDLFMRNFVRNSSKGGRCNSFKQHYKSGTSDEVFNNFSKKLNVTGNICDLLEMYSAILHKYAELYAKEFDSKYEDCKVINQMEKTDYINNKPNMLSIHEQMSKLELIETQMDFDATSLYPSSMWDDNSIYPKIETGYAFKSHKNDVFVNDFNNKTFNRDGIDNANLIEYYNP